MAEQSPKPDGTQAMAFELVLHKLSDLEEGLRDVQQMQRQMVPLLGKIIAHLEAQNKVPEVPVATYAQLYEELQPDDAEEAPARAHVAPLPTPKPRRRVRQWFTREVPSADD